MRPWDLKSDNFLINCIKSNQCQCLRDMARQRKSRKIVKMYGVCSCVLGLLSMGFALCWDESFRVDWLSF